MVKLIKILKRILQGKKTDYTYSELFNYYVETTGNFSTSSFEKFLTFCYGQNFINRSGKMEKTFFKINLKNIEKFFKNIYGEQKNVKS